MVRARVNGSNKRVYRVKARALGLQLGGSLQRSTNPQLDRGGASSFLRVNRPLIMVRARVNGSNKRLYRVKARALGLQLGGELTAFHKPPAGSRGSL